MNNNLHDLKKYCLPPFEKRLRAYILVCGIFAVLLFLLLSGLIPDILTLWLFLSFPVTLVICRHHVTVVPRKRLNRKLAQCRKDGTLNAVLRDFNIGARISKGNLIIGQECMFGQGYGLFVLYRNVEKYIIRTTIEQKIIDKNHDTMETVSRDFLDVCVGGKWYCLCEYYESPDANVRFHEFLHSKNSGIVYENRN